MPALAKTTADPPVRADLNQLQGSWVTVAGVRPARLLVAGDRYAVEFADGDIYIGRLDLDPPIDMDMHIDGGPAKHADTVSLCLYRFEDGLLYWCPGRPGSGRRPAEFAEPDDAQRLSLVFRRATRR